MASQGTPHGGAAHTSRSSVRKAKKKGGAQEKNKEKMESGPIPTIDLTDPNGPVEILPGLSHEYSNQVIYLRDMVKAWKGSAKENAGKAWYYQREAEKLQRQLDEARKELDRTHDENWVKMEEAKSLLAQTKAELQLVQTEMVWRGMI